MTRAWKSRIVGQGAEDPMQLVANPRNWRVHPGDQQDALSDMLDQVGWVQQVLVNRTTGNVVDGHLRVELAISKGEPMVPVLYVELDEAEEAAVLATLDPLAAMAATDQEKLAELLQEATIESDRLMEELTGMIPEDPDAPPHGADDPGQDVGGQYAVAVLCSSEEHQREVFERLSGDGYACKVLTV
jgi:ParB-like chromosome segregation protein Spo0J